MKRNKIKVIILTGDGINCESETALAFNELGVHADVIHIADLISEPQVLEEAQILVLPGGFSFGDEIGSGQILALKLKYLLGDQLKKFVEAQKLIIGICNGFQVLVRLGFLPKPFTKREMTLTHNRQGHFINKWVELHVPSSNCIWTNNLKEEMISLPIRHGEGKIVFSGDEYKQKMIFNNLQESGQLALYYMDDVNGSYEKIAGVCDPTGRIFGLMPHPEAAISFWHNPDGNEKSDSAGIGLMIFESGINYCESNL